MASARAAPFRPPVPKDAAYRGCPARPPMATQASDPPTMMPYLTSLSATCRPCPTLSASRSLSSPLWLLAWLHNPGLRWFPGWIHILLPLPSARPGGGTTKFTAYDIDLHNRLVSKRSMQNQHVG